jgi:granule-bound starch synthase
VNVGGTPYGEEVVFVANDWHAALVPMYIKQAKAKGEWTAAKTVALCHNMVFQGRFPSAPNADKRLHLTADLIESMSVKQTLKVGNQHKQTKGLKSKEKIANPEMLCLNFLLGAIKAADLCLTVSPSYALEVATDPIKGAEMEDALVANGIKGILNGVEDVVRPDNAELGLAENCYDSTSLEKKTVLKMAMQKALNLPVDGDIPLFVFLGRLDAQKGVDIMFEAIAKALDGGMKAQFITMGSGIEALEEVAADLDDRFPDQFRAVLSFKGAEKYKTYAAADFAMMPSRYEPCGLVQMEGMRFGVLPIVSPTGGLGDTVQDMKTGLVMEREVDQDGLEEADVEMLLKNIERAMTLFRSPAEYRKIQIAAMEAAGEFSWTNSVKHYVAEFKKLGVKTI